MHYGTRFFSKNDGKTIQTKNNGRNTENSPANKIGEAYYKYDGPVLSTQDILETNLLYKCTKITGNLMEINTLHMMGLASIFTYLRYYNSEFGGNRAYSSSTD